MKISVIITCFNLERFIGEAIESVLSQEIGWPVELIVVDDCSTDGSREVIRQYGLAELISTKTNSGVLLALLEGLRLATGEYIFLLDGDDRWAPDKIHRMVALFEAFPKMVFATHDLRYIDHEGSVITKKSRVSYVMQQVGESGSSDAIRTGIVELLDYVWLGSAIGIRRSLADLEGFSAFARALPDPRNTYQDWPLAMWLATRSHTHVLGYSNRELFDYRIHRANHSGDARTLERAIRNFRRARNTTAAMLAIAEAAPMQPLSLTSLRQALWINAGQLALYQGRASQAIVAYTRALPRLFRTRTAAREVGRLLIGVIVGGSGLIRLSEQRRRVE